MMALVETRRFESRIPRPEWRTHAWMSALHSFATNSADDAGFDTMRARMRKEVERCEGTVDEVRERREGTVKSDEDDTWWSLDWPCGRLRV